ncbi:response regulator transcription factor [Cohnella sp. 56]|uniref:response regulator transcription factor n=1 Tax=Cohnella sp. 56 TaxID=3113722 RepID=UPI0030E93034
MLKVLIVDDKTTVVSGLRRMVPWSELNAEIVGECRNGKEALEQALLHHPELIITDVRMPVMDGLELSRIIHEKAPETVVIILSAFDDFTYAQTAMRYGVSDYILKPIDKDKLNQLIRRVAEISLHHEKKLSLVKLLYHTNLEQKLSSAIRTGEVGFVDTFFESDFPNLEETKFELVKDFSLKLLHILIECTASLGLALSSFGLTEEKAWQQLLGANTKKELKATISRLYREVTGFISDKKNSRGHAIIEQVKKYIAGNYHDPDLTLYTISNELQLSPNYTSVIFREIAGENISYYITRLRVEKACELLKEPGMPINDTALKVGYTDPHYFAKVFKKYKDLTPSQYKNVMSRVENR